MNLHCTPRVRLVRCRPSLPTTSCSRPIVGYLAVMFARMVLIVLSFLAP